MLKPALLILVCLTLLGLSLRLLYNGMRQTGNERILGRLSQGLALWILGVLLGLAEGGWIGALLLLLVPPAVVRLFVSWRYQRRLARMVEQLPMLLDHAVRSLKSGRTLADAVLGAIDAAE